MIIQKQSIPDCREGDILASDVVNLNGVILAAKDTLLNDYIIEKLIANGIKEAFVYHCVKNSNNSDFNDFKKDYSNTIVQTKKVFQDLLSGKFVDYQHIMLIAKDIQSFVSYGDNIIKSMDKLRKADEYTYYHSINVAFYSLLISRGLNLSDEKILIAIQCGLLHDLGKMKIPKDILNKKGILTKDEFEVIKKHTILGYELVERIDGLDYDIKMAVLLHHERMDGSGYPFQYKSEQKDYNLYSKIVAIADVFDAMTSERVYKKKSTPFDVFEMFQTVGITLFDTGIMKIFMERLATYLVGSKVILSNEEQGEIAYIPLHNITCPIVKVSSGYLDLVRSKSIKIVSML